MLAASAARVLQRAPSGRCGDELKLLAAHRPDGIFIAPFERGEIGPDLFRKACEFGLEGLVSKHRERAYRAALGELDQD
jgi:hypothetical protein